MQAVIYARQSSGDEEDSLSIDAQVEACEKLAKANGMKIVGIFKDLNTSGTTYPIGSETFAENDLEWMAYRTQNAHVQKRPYRKGLADALKTLPANGYFLVNDSTRFMRPLPNSFISSHLIQKLKTKQALLWSVTEGKLDYDRADTKLIQTIREQIENEAKEKRRVASIEGKRRRKDKGLFQGRTAFGYKFNGNSFDIVPEEAKIVKSIYQQYLDGLGANRIATDCAKQGFPTKEGGRWYMESVVGILKRPEYIGMTYDSKGELIPSKSIVPIIDKGVWFAVQDKRRGIKQRGGYHAGKIHPLAGLLRCGHCGASMIAAPAWHGVIITCPTGKKNKTSEGRHPICSKSEVLEESKAKHVNGRPEEFRNYGIVDSLYPIAILASHKASLKKAALTSSVEHRVRLENDATRLRMKLEELKGLWLSESITAEMFGSLSKELKAQLRAVDDEASNMKNLEQSEQQKQISDWLLINTQIKEGTLPKTLLSELLHDVISKVIVHPYSIAVTLFDGSEFEIERIIDRNARSFPAWRLKDTVVRYGDESKDSKSKSYQVIEYYYKSSYAGDKQEKRIYASRFFEIWTIGVNPVKKT